MKYYERWWQSNIDRRGAEFAGWLADSDPSSRDAVGAIVDTLPGMVDVLECGPGTYLDYGRLWECRKKVAYHAIDVTPAIVERGRARGLEDVRLGSVEEIPYKAASMDVVYCRHVLEHLPSYRTALLEMHRVCRKHAIAVFWRLDPTGERDLILWNAVADVPDVFHNLYSQPIISAWLTSMRIAHRWQQTDADWLLVLDAGRTPG